MLLCSGNARSEQTIAFIRHGEKPAEGLGQLNCQGLQRSLALPNVLVSKFGPPDAIFAPNPANLKNDHGKRYAYIRPLATIEPTAIKYNLPVNLEFGFEDSLALIQTLVSDKYKNKVIFVAWEHHWAEHIVKELVLNYSAEKEIVASWADDDFDSVYVVKINELKGKKMARFYIVQQGLNHVPSHCDF